MFVFGGMRNNRPLYTYTGAKSLSVNSAGAYVLRLTTTSKHKYIY